MTFKVQYLHSAKLNINRSVFSDFSWVVSLCYDYYCFKSQFPPQIPAVSTSGSRTRSWAPATSSTCTPSWPGARRCPPARLRAGTCSASPAWPSTGTSEVRPHAPHHQLPVSFLTTWHVYTFYSTPMCFRGGRSTGERWDDGVDRTEPSEGRTGVAVVWWSSSVIGQFHHRYWSSDRCSCCMWGIMTSYTVQMCNWVEINSRLPLKIYICIFCRFYLSRENVTSFTVQRWKYCDPNASQQIQGKSSCSQ